MARIRTIKPGFFTSGDIVDLSPLARLFYIGLWCESDREGRLNWNTRTLKLRYLPADECDIEALASELIEREMLVIYEVDGKQYAEIPSFAKHQVINNREAKSQIPARHFDASGTRESKVKTTPPTEISDASFTRESGVKAEGRKGREDKTVTNVTDADASSVSVIWNLGLEILKRHGGSESSSRSFLGRFAKQDEDKLAETIAYLAANPKVEPRAYIAAAMTPRKRQVVV